MVAGELRRSSKTFPTRGEAVAWLREHTKPAAAETLGEWLRQWLEIVKPDVAAQTYKPNEFRVHRWLIPKLGQRKLRDLTALDISGMLARMQSEDAATESERHKAGRLLRQALRSAVAHRLIPASPMQGLTVPKPKVTEKRAMTPEEVAALVKAADAINRGHVYRLWIDAGLRPGELLALTWDRFDWDRGEVSIRWNLCGRTNVLKELKTKRSRRVIRLAPSTLAACRAVCPITGGPFEPDSRGRTYWQTNYAREFARFRLTADLPWVTLYTFRHTMATLLLRAGVPIKVVSQRLGHEDIATTLRTYAHAMEGDQERAANAMETILNPPSPPVTHGDGTDEKPTS